MTLLSIPKLQKLAKLSLRTLLKMMNKRNLTINKTKINNNAASNEPQFAGEWGDTPGGPEDGPQFPESPKQNAPQAL